MFDLLTPEQKRQAIPMTRYWHMKRGLKNSVEAIFEPITFMFGLATDWLNTVAGQLQQHVFYNKKES